ncbi:tRNA (adenine(58)-N(1))-methyltransferase, mitochondrial [Pseudonaja textilis]|uniref:tRNA (adenine(58)-N(1))-methyltransferase, mitochondrial n=1 Tax=Pseudonaja textilis TaxID=8673 RepID=UPI000EAA8C20|nr:tRNA (adenine(58)-N(1))-methyltransferase, mitochondrial [Pseudonaja textilis]
MGSCWQRLGLGASQGRIWASLRTKMREDRSIGDAGRKGLHLRAGVPGTVVGRSKAHRHQLQGKPTADPQGVGRWVSSTSAGDGDGRDELPEQVSAESQTDSFRLRETSGTRRGSLSPLERLSRMIPAELLSAEVRALRSEEVKESKSQGCDTGVAEEGVFPGADSQLDRGSLAEKMKNASSRNCPFRVGELILIEGHGKHGTNWKIQCLLTGTGTCNTNVGFIRFSEIVGRFPGQLFHTSRGKTLMIRRPSLEEYVLLMDRKPTIISPKDANTMLLLMDITQGDTVLEAGSGSGSMSLFLSKAVGSQGHVISYEIIKQHHKLAEENFCQWRNAWKIGHDKEWPDNVDFINQDILTAAEDLKSVTLDAVVLDMLCPQNALPVIFPSLKQGGVCVAYFANITQVIELMEAIRIRKLALFCEKVLEVTHRDWLICPATWEKRNVLKNIASELNLNDETVCHHENDDSAEERGNEALASANIRTPYIARPFPYQAGYTVFLVKLRKFNSLYPNTASDGMCQSEDRASSEITH